MSQSTKIGLATAIIVGMNAMIGAGIFTVPAALQMSVGPAGLLTYFLAIIVVITIAYALARVAQLHPHAGAFYTYAAQWGGNTIGAATTLLYSTGLIIALALLTKITSSYIALYLPVTPLISSVVILALVALLNIAGARLNSLGQLILLILTLAPLMLITLLCFSIFDAANFTPFMPYGAGAVVTAIKIVIFGFFGFEAISALTALVEHPHKNVPRAILVSVGAVGLLYMLFTAAIMGAFSQTLFISAAMPLTQALMTRFNYPWLIGALDGAIIITILGTIHAMVWALSELLFSTVSSRCAITKKQIIVALAIIIGVVSVMLQNIDLFFSLTALCITLAYASACAALLVQPRWSDKILAVAALAACGLVFICALDGVRHLI